MPSGHTEKKGSFFFRKLDLEDFLELGAQIFTEFQYHAETFENEVFGGISREKKIQKNMNLTIDFGALTSNGNPMKIPLKITLRWS